MARLLVFELGATVDTMNAAGLTALYLAAAEGHADVCFLVKGCGAAVDSADSSGHTASFVAAVTGQLDTLRLLTKECGATVHCGATVDSADN